MKRYIILAGDDYYPSGWLDYRGTCDTIVECLELLVTLQYDWYDIIDTTTALSVKSGNKEKGY